MGVPTPASISTTASDIRLVFDTPLVFKARIMSVNSHDNKLTATCCVMERAQTCRNYPLLIKVKCGLSCLQTVDLLCSQNKNE